VRTAHGFDLVGPAAGVEDAASQLPTDGVLVGETAYEAWRIELGIPLQPLDLDGSTIPQEAFLERDALSFEKGCFLGQELVCRIDSRGHVNRFLRKLTAIEGDWPERGAEIVVDDKVVGALTSVAPADLPTGALGYVRREVEPPTEVTLQWPNGSARATVVALDEPAG
jgi:folate-binding protein YgfZ